MLTSHPGVLLALLGAAACNGPAPEDTTAPADSGGAADTADAGDGPTGVDLAINGRALASCDAYTPITTAGWAVQTPDDVRVGVVGVQLLRAHDDAAPVPVRVADTPLEADLSAGSELVRLDTGSIPEGTYTWLAFDLAWASFSVDATAHDAVTVGGTLTFDVALASYTAADGGSREQGDVVATFEVYGTEVSYPTSTTISCPLSASGGHPDPSDGVFRVRVPIPSGPLTISHAAAAEVTIEVDFPLADSFAWTDKSGTGYADGTYDLAMDLSATEVPEALPVCSLLLADRCEEGAVAARPWPPGPMPEASTWTVTDDTVLDEVTGLLWERGHSPATQDWWGSLDYCTSLSIGGRDDWMLPSRIELISILDLGVYNPTIDGSAFPDTPPAFFWSSSPLPYSNLAYGVRFEQGYMYDHDPASAGYARCVADAPVSEGTRWALTTDTVEDLRTGLVWQRATPAEAFDWTAGIAQCDELTLAGSTAWRLPTLKELETILDETRWGPAIDEVAFPDTPAEWYWASNPAADAPGYPWAASFTNGYTTPAAEGERYRVRCVR